MTNIQDMKKIDIRTVDKSSLAELRAVQIRKDESNQLDVSDLQQQTENFYCYRVGNIAVAFDYMDNGKSINDIFALMVQSCISHI